jgi:chromosome segregation ATPase
VSGGNTAAAEPSATDFDEVARTLTEGLGAQLASLRAIVAEAEATRERDRGEIARLTAELDDRGAELADRNGTIESMQQTLRELADSLERRP